MVIRIRVIRVLVGVAAGSWKKTSFNRVQVEYSLFHNWSERFGVKPGNGDGVAVTLKSPNNVTISTVQGVEIKMIYKFSIQHQVSGVDVREENLVEFRFDKALAVESIVRDYINLLRRLLTLFCGEKVYVDQINFLPEGDSVFRNEVQLLKSNPGVSKADRELLSLHMLVPYSEIAANFPVILNHWFEYHRKLESVLDLYFATVFNPNLYADHQFLFLAQALEVYHNYQGAFSTKIDPTDVFRKRMETLLSHVPQEERAWLREKLHYSNKKTLAQRLDDILKAHTDDVARFIPNTKVFSDLVRHTRNYYTHFDEELVQRGKVADGIELSRLTKQMSTLLEICILKDLGVPSTAIKRVIGQFLQLKFRSFE